MRVGTYDCAESAIRFCSEIHVEPGVELKAVHDSPKRHIESLEGRHELCPKHGDCCARSENCEPKITGII